MMIFSCATSPSEEDIRTAEALKRLGSSYLTGGNLNSAYVEFQKSIELNPRDKETLNYLGYVSARFGKLDEAIEYYRKAIAVDPDYADAINNLGVIYVRLGRWDEAVESFRAAIQKPTYQYAEGAYTNMGYAYYRKGDYQAAEKALREALIRNPISPRAMLVLGLVYEKLGREDDALDQFMKVLGVMPDYLDAHWELANLYMRQGKKAKALKHFRVVAEKDESPERVRRASEFINKLKY
jgi:type IV pilus biogenesis/stability protein PilW